MRVKQAQPNQSEDQQLTDTDLMLAWRDGDARAFDRLYQRHRAPLHRYLLRHCGNTALADELFQDIWMKLIDARDAYQPTAKFSTWLYRIAHNRLVDQYRRDARNPVTSDPDAEDSHDAGPARLQANAELGQALLQAVQNLPVEQRSAFLLKQERGLSLEDIGEVMGVGRETIKSRLRYAIDKLRSELANQYAEHQEAGHG